MTPLTPLTRHARHLATLSVLSFALFGAIASPAAADEPIIANHNCTVLEDIPTCWIEKAKEQLRLSYGHTSHGSQIVSGMNVIKDVAGSLYWWDHDGTAGGLSLWDYTPAGDLGNPNYTTWATRTRDMLEADGCDRNVVMWSWCGQADTSEANIQIYLDLMDGLQNDYPGVTFIYMTGHLNGSGEGGNLNLRNNQIRAHCIANNCVLFDFADIESYDPDGEYFNDRHADDGCNYDGGNWANEWCAENSGDELCAACSCAHSLALNCNLKARAFWWMMARAAGWDGAPAVDCNDNGIADSCDIADGVSRDCDGNGTPDECEDFCPWDTAPGVGDCTVGLGDLNTMLSNWGPCPDPCDWDYAPEGGDDMVGLGDLNALLSNWGPCM